MMKKKRTFNRLIACLCALSLCVGFIRIDAYALPITTDAYTDLQNLDAIIENEEETLMENSSFSQFETRVNSSSDLNNALKNKILSKKSKFPEGVNWDPNNKGWNNGKARECYGFAITMMGQIFKDYPTCAHIRGTANKGVAEGWTCYHVNSDNCSTLKVEPGDIIDCRTSSQWNHTAMVVSVDNGMITCVQANNSGDNKVYWSKRFNYNSGNKTLKNIYDKYKSCNTGSGTSSKVMRLWKPSENLKIQATGYQQSNNSTLKISGVSPITSIEQGKAWSCNGTISSNYKLNQVYGAILKSDGVSVVCSKTVNPNNKSYNLKNSAIDKALLFNKLSPGTYYYVVDAKDTSGKKLNVVKNKFTVKEKAKAPSTLKISGASALTTIQQGKAWTCNGTISSNYKLNQVYGAILKSDGISIVYSKTVSPNNKSYNLKNSAIDKALLFNKLSPGTYYYVVDAKDTSGKKLNVIKNKFTVQERKKAPSTLKISGNTSLSTLRKGKSWTCNGTISSNYKLNQVYGAILKSDGTSVLYKKTVNPNNKSYNLKNSAIDKALLFNKLPEGTYYYVVDAKDTSGNKVNVVKNKFTVKENVGKIYNNPVPAATIIGKGSGDFKAGGTHRGVDFSAPGGSPIYALADGVVEVKCKDGSYGNLVVIRHTDGSGLYSLYAHMQNNSVTVKSGSKVKKGQQIGKVGSTGNSTGNHLHLEIATGRVKGKYLSNNKLTYLVNPKDYINLP